METEVKPAASKPVLITPETLAEMIANATRAGAELDRHETQARLRAAVGKGEQALASEELDAHLSYVAGVVAHARRHSSNEPPLTFPGAGGSSTEGV